MSNAARKLAGEASAARVLATMRPIDREFLLGRASLEQVVADLPEGVPAHLALAYTNELRELLELGMTMEEAEAATREVSFTGSAEEVVRWLESEEQSTCSP